MNIIDALKFIVEYYDTEEFKNINEEAEEAIEDLTDAAKWLLEKYGEEI